MRVSRLPQLVSALALTAYCAGCGITPEPLDPIEVSALAGAHAERVTAGQEPISGPISLFDAMARALKYNLDYRVEIMQEQLRGGEVILAGAELLPRAAANAGFSERNNFLTTGELDIPTGIELPPETVSQDRKLDTADITFSWHILDFALSYVRARQASNKYLIAQELKRKVIQRTIEDTRTAFWRAYSADRLVRKLRGLEGRVQQAIANAQSLSKRGDMSPLTALTYERELIEIRQLAQKLENDLNLAKSQLAALMDVPPGTAFSLAADVSELPSPAMLDLSGQEMIAEAVFNRAEIRELAYKRRINDAEVAAALLDLLPGLQIYTGDNYESNSFLLHPEWTAWGAKAAWNLIKITQLPARYRAVDAQDDVLDQQALAMTMVVMTQVYVSRIRYRHFVKELEISRNFFDVQAKLTEHVRAEAAAGKVSEQILIREEMNELIADVKRDIALANTHTGAANVFASMGLDLQADEINDSLDVKTLGKHLRALWADRSAVSARGQYLLELEKAKAEARRAAEEEARRIKQEAMLKAREEQLQRQQAQYDAWRGRGGGSLKDEGGYTSLKDGGRHAPLK